MARYVLPSVMLLSYIRNTKAANPHKFEQSREQLTIYLPTMIWQKGSESDSLPPNMNITGRNNDVTKDILSSDEEKARPVRVLAYCVS
jgi:hypothetical protein